MLDAEGEDVTKRIGGSATALPVSYTHLDVYKRQGLRIQIY